MDDRMLRVGIVGAGGIARGAHVPGYRSSGRADVKAVCDVNAEAARVFSDTQDIPHHYGSVEAMLAQEELDVVSICTSNDAHHPAALAAIERGLHVFCEKPLALNFAQAREMYEAAQSQGVVTGINFTYRTFPAARYVKELAEQKLFGDVKHFSIEYFQSYSVNPNRSLEWRISKEAHRHRCFGRPRVACHRSCALAERRHFRGARSHGDIYSRTSAAGMGPAWVLWTWMILRNSLCRTNAAPRA